MSLRIARFGSVVFCPPALQTTGVKKRYENQIGVVGVEGGVGETTIASSIQLS